MELAGVVVICALFVGNFFFGLAGLHSFSHKVPLSGGTYREAVVGAQQVPNPLFDSTNPTDQDIVALVFSGMAKRNPAGKIVPDIAKSWTVSSDLTTYSVTLRNNVKFQDGIPLTAHDVAFTIQVIQSSDYQGSLSADWKGVTVDVQDDTHLTLKLPSPYAFFTQNLTLPILPEHLLREIPPASMRYADFNNHPIGSGPYSYDALTVIENKDQTGGKLEEVSLRRNSLYYGTQPHISQIVLKAYDTPQHAYQSYIRRETDAISRLDSSDVAAAVRWPNLRLMRTSLPEYVALFFNMTRQGFVANATLRQDIAASIDRSQIISDDLNNEGYPVRLAVLPGYPGYDPNISTPSFNPAAVDQSLDENGWPKGTDGIRVKDGQRLTLNLLTVRTDEYAAVATTLRSQLRSIGIQLNVKMIPSSQVNQTILTKHDYDILLFGQHIGASGDLYSFWHSTQIGGAGTNLSQYSAIRVDKSLEEARTASSPSVVADEYHRLAGVIASDTPAVFLYTPTYVFAVDTRIHGVTLPNLAEPADRWSDFAGRFIDYRTAY
jgi:peptide/nickel transport system substrate-binding protein